MRPQQLLPVSAAGSGRRRCCSSPVPSTTKKSPDRSRIPVDIPSRWEPPGPYGLHLLIFPQPLGRALKNQNAAPTTPPCFCRRQRSSSLLFESCTVHHTVRTRTRFFTKKGSGTFFVYGRFCGKSTQSSKQAKAGYHHDGGILPFVLRNQVRFVRTWSSTLYGALGAIATYVRTWPVRTYVVKRKSSCI